MNETRCPRCGGVNPANSLFCSNCGLQFGMPAGIPNQPVAPGATTYYPPPPPPSYPVPPAKSNRALIAIICSVVGLVGCGLASILGGVLGKLEMDAIREGRAPQSGENMAKWAFYLGIAGTAIWGLMICVYWGRFSAFY